MELVASAACGISLQGFVGSPHELVKHAKSIDVGTCGFRPAMTLV
jgi:hypothetical protein